MWPSLNTLNKWYPGISGISIPLEIAVQTHVHVQHDTKFNPAFLHADEKASWFLLSTVVSLLSGSKVQPKNTYSCMLQGTRQIWDSPKMISININCSYHEFSSPKFGVSWSNNQFAKWPVSLISCILLLWFGNALVIFVVIIIEHYYRSSNLIFFAFVKYFCQSIVKRAVLYQQLRNFL